MITEPQQWYANNGLLFHDPYGVNFLDASNSTPDPSIDQTPNPKKNDPPPPPPPDDTGTKPDPKNTPPPDDLARLTDILGKLFGQSITIPAPGQPTVIPDQTQTSNPLPILLIIGGLGIVGFVIYKKGKK